MQKLGTADEGLEGKCLVEMECERLRHRREIAVG